MFLSKFKRQLGLLLIGLFVSNTNLFSQDNTPDFAHSIGKIYVVVAVIVTIFIGIIGFLLLIERKVSRLEKQMHNEE